MRNRSFRIDDFMCCADGNTADVAQPNTTPTQIQRNVGRKVAALAVLTDTAELEAITLLSRLLSDAKTAHTSYAATNPPDHSWEDWYADYIVNRLRNL